MTDAFDIQAEQAVLGAMIINPKHAVAVREVLTPEHFYETRHGDVFEAVCYLLDEFDSCDYILVRDRLQAKRLLEGVGGSDYLIRMSESYEAQSGANVPYYADIIRQQAWAREVRNLGNALKGTNRAEIDEAYSKIAAFSEKAAHISSNAIPTLQGAIDRAQQELEERHDGTYKTVRFGWPQMDKMLDGMPPGMLTILGGRPGQGKTTVAQNIIVKACIEGGHPVLFFSAEVPDTIIVKNLAQIMGEINYSEMRRGQFIGDHYDKWQQAKVEIGGSPLLLDADGRVDLDLLLQRARAAVLNNKVELIIVDHIQQLSVRGESARNLQIARATHELKALALRHHVHVLALSQLGRPRADQPGQWLKWSGEQEEVADRVINILHDTKEDSEDEHKDVVKRKLLIAKNRHGRVGSVEFEFHKPILTFKEIPSWMPKQAT